MVLREHSAAQLVVPDDLAFNRNQLSKEEFQQSRLSDSIGAQNADSRLQVDAEVDLSEEDAVRRITESDVIRLQNRELQLWRLFERLGRIVHR